MNSMTGFMVATKDFGAGRVSVKAKSVNSRGLDIYVHLPSFLASSEVAIRAKVKKYFLRGAIDLTVDVEKVAQPKIKVDEALVESWKKAFESVAKSFGAKLDNEGFLNFILTRPNIFTIEESDIEEKTAQDIEQSIKQNIKQNTEQSVGQSIEKSIKQNIGQSIKALAKQDFESGGLAPKNVLESTDKIGKAFEADEKSKKGFERCAEEQTLSAVVAKALDEALEGLLKARAYEGEYLQHDILEKLGALEKLVEKIDAWQPQMEGAFRALIKKKLEELKGTFLSEGAKAIDEGRMAEEVALMLVRYTISEEVVRLKSHIQKLGELLKEAGAIGKRIEFFTQEIGRELNTVASKSTNAQVSQLVISAKDITEAIKEQSRNIE